VNNVAYTGSAFALHLHMKNSSPLVKELEAGLNGGNAHASFEDAVKNIPFKHLGEIPDGLPYSLWQLVEHLRLAQWDILDFCRNPDYRAMEWPAAYWPKEKAPAHAGDLKKSVDQILADRQAFIHLLREAGDDLHTQIPHGDGQTLFREAILIIDHNSYHTGEIVLLRRLLGDWK
jgi:DinB superfamily